MHLISISLSVDAGVRAKLERIMSLDYYTARTEIRATQDLAASVGSYGPGVGQAQESTVVPPQAPEAAEESTTVEGNKVKSWMLYNSLINFCFM